MHIIGAGYQSPFIVKVFRMHFLSVDVPDTYTEALTICKLRRPFGIQLNSLSLN